MASFIGDLASRAAALGGTVVQLGGTLGTSAVQLGETLGESLIQLGDAALEPVRPEPGPVDERWGVGVGEFAAGLPVVPGLLRGIVRQLNQFGSVVVSPGGIEFDGDEMAWNGITEIRTHRLLGYLLTDAIRKQAGRLPMGWFPGRGLVIEGLTHAALTAVAVAADGRLDSGVFAARIPAEVHSKGLWRTKQMSPGVPAALVLADPSVNDCVLATARAHGITVRPADNDAMDAAERRAAMIRSVFGRIGAVTRIRGNGGFLSRGAGGKGGKATATNGGRAVDGANGEVT